MGIKHFFYWFKQNHGECIQTTYTNTPLSEQGFEVDVLALDLNGLFHTAAQRVYQYGSKSGTKLPRLLGKQREPTPKALQAKCFKEVCDMIDGLVWMVQPKKRLLLCVDGVAGLSKCQQQRQRRFKSAKERVSNENTMFDSCSITPGTMFMHQLNTYIEWHIFQRCVAGGKWTHLEVIFSSEKVVGEGEHKCKQLFLNHCDSTERMMIYGLDADLIMLCLSTRLPHIYVYRDNIYNSKERFIVDIAQFAHKLESQLKTSSAILDFVFMCFMVGNDFLPQIPSLEIMTNGIERMLEIYQSVCTDTQMGLIEPDTFQIRLPILLAFFREMSVLEELALKDKYLQRRKYFEDPLLNRHFQLYPPKMVVGDVDAYKREYYTQKMQLPLNEVSRVCCEYIAGLQWVITYYCSGMPNWLWFYPYHYAPFLSDLARTTEYVFTPFPETEPLNTFEQLLAVLPPQSASLLPITLQTLMTDGDSVLQPYYPTEFKIDITGKRAEWEGIALLPIMDISLLKRVFQEKVETLTDKEMRRNRREQTYRIVSTEYPYTYTNLYGTISHCSIGKVSL